MVVSGYFSPLWSGCESQPQFWTKFQVWEWLQQVLDMHQMDTSNFPFQNFNVDGHQLCNLSHQDYVCAAGSVGSILFQRVTELKWGGAFSFELRQKISFTLHTPSHSDTWVHNAQQYKKRYLNSDRGLSQDLVWYSNCCKSKIYDPLNNSPGPSPTSIPSEKSTMQQYRCSYVKKHNQRGTHLWEFIRDILLNPERNPGLIKWEDRTEGVFRFLKSEAVAQLWGKKKNNSSMTYEKLSRAMRYYYKREILERVDGRRLVYKFGRNARGWRESEK
uniref:ETS homologous factor n=1 Tax=Tetraodon nigroviridis TaxID=99883 RepID=H3D1D2_TETNG